MAEPRQPFGPYYALRTHSDTSVALLEKKYILLYLQHLTLVLLWNSFKKKNPASEYKFLTRDTSWSQSAAFSCAFSGQSDNATFFSMLTRLYRIVGFVI